jgi:hypothetical protein
MPTPKKKPDADTEATPRTNPFITKSLGQGDQGSRNKAEKAAERADEEIKRVQNEPLAVTNNVCRAVPRGSKGSPMIQAEMSAAELIPTGQYANVSVGPARLHFWIDPDRELKPGESYFSEEQRDTVTKALNEAAEMVEGDVIAVQRNLVLESMQQQGDQG